MGRILKITFLYQEAVYSFVIFSKLKHMFSTQASLITMPSMEEYSLLTLIAIYKLNNLHLNKTLQYSEESEELKTVPHL